ncbi:MAG: hypothetical protein V7679_06285 [Parasphingorhabdus sp.]
MRPFLLAVCLPLVITGCMTMPTKAPASDIDTAVANPELPSGSGKAARGLLFAETYCAACHGVTSGQISTNQNAPPFESIVNVRGLTENSMKTWLRDSHNYPEQMDFAIDAKRIDELAVYMLTLKSPDYRPPIQ